MRPVHGTRSCYSNGCRLPECRAANNAYSRKRRTGTPIRLPAIIDRRDQGRGLRIETWTRTEILTIRGMAS